MLSKEEAAIMIFVPIRWIGVATCVTPTDRGGSLTRTMGPGSNKSVSLSLPLLSSLSFLFPFISPLPLLPRKALEEIFAFRRMRGSISTQHRACPIVIEINWVERISKSIELIVTKPRWFSKYTHLLIIGLVLFSFPADLKGSSIKRDIATISKWFLVTLRICVHY